MAETKTPSVYDKPKDAAPDVAPPEATATEQARMDDEAEAQPQAPMPRVTQKRVTQKAGAKKAGAKDPIEGDYDKDDLPPVGARVWYRLRANHGEWVPGVVISKIGDTVLEPPLDEDTGQIHLSATVDRRRHNAASNTIYRQNVLYGTEPGCWAAHEPRTNQRDVERSVQHEADQREARLEFQRGG